MILISAYKNVGAYFILQVPEFTGTFFYYKPRSTNLIQF